MKSNLTKEFREEGFSVQSQGKLRPKVLALHQGPHGHSFQTEQGKAFLDLKNLICFCYIFLASALVPYTINLDFVLFCFLHILKKVIRRLRKPNLHVPRGLIHFSDFLNKEELVIGESPSQHGQSKKLC